MCRVCIANSDLTECNEADIVEYFRKHEAPFPREHIYELPAEFSFPISPSDRKLIVRDCFDPMLRIVDKLINDKEDGVIFSGPQGNGKVIERF